MTFSQTPSRIENFFSSLSGIFGIALIPFPYQVRAFYDPLFPSYVLPEIEKAPLLNSVLLCSVIFLITAAFKLFYASILLPFFPTWCEQDTKLRLPFFYPVLLL